MNPRQRAIVKYVVETTAAQSAAGESPGVLVADIAKRFKLAKDVVRAAMRVLARKGYVEVKRQPMTLPTTFADSGSYTKTMLVYVPGAKARA